MVQPTPLSAVFVGQGTLLVRCAERFRAAGHMVVAVVSSEPRVRQWAVDAGIPTVEPVVDLAAALSTYRFDYLFSVANMRVLGADVLTLPASGLALNYHDALLPRYAGVHATSWAIMHGEPEHGVTWHEMLPRVDAGRILKQRAFAVAPDETAVSLNARCYEAGLETFAELVDELATGTAVYADPCLAERTYFPLYKRPEGGAVLRWERPADELNALARALDFGPADNPLGLPRVAAGGAVLLAPRVEPFATASGAAPGTVVRLDASGLVVATATEDVLLPELLSVDGQTLTAVDLARRGVQPGVRLGPRASGRAMPLPTRAPASSAA